MSNLVPAGTSLSDAISLFKQVVADRQVTKYVQTAALSVMLYDNMLTFPQEVGIIWGSRWSRGKVLFLLTRWPVIIESVMYLVVSMDLSLPVSFCRMEDNLTSWGVLIFLIPLQIVIVMRTVALWNEKRLVSYLLTFSALATDIALVGLLANTSKNELHFSADVQLTPVFGCFANLTTFNPKSSTAGWGATMVFDFAIFSLTLVRALKMAKHERTPLLRVLIVDGFAYYCIMLAISILALTFSITLDPRREILLAMVPPVFKACYCILGSRIALRLRESFSRSVIDTRKSRAPGDTEDIELSTFYAASRAPETGTEGAGTETVIGEGVEGAL